MYYNSKIDLIWKRHIKRAEITLLLIALVIITIFIYKNC